MFPDNHFGICVNYQYCQWLVTKVEQGLQVAADWSLPSWLRRQVSQKQQQQFVNILPKAGEYFVRTALRAHLHLSAARRNFPNGEIIGQSY